jgi:hypothetical protein
MKLILAIIEFISMEKMGDCATSGELQIGSKCSFEILFKLVSLYRVKWITKINSFIQEEEGDELAIQLSNFTINTGKDYDAYTNIFATRSGSPTYNIYDGVSQVDLITSYYDKIWRLGYKTVDTDKIIKMNFDVTASLRQVPLADMSNLTIMASVSVVDAKLEETFVERLIYRSSSHVNI